MLPSLLLMTAVTLGQAPAPDADTFFELKIRPVLAESCFKCHGDKKSSGGLRVDSRAALLKGGGRGPAVVPGDPAKSLLVQALRHAHDEVKMPPGKRLTDAITGDFASWIQQGAHWPQRTAAAFRSQKHWAFEPIRDVEPPPDSTGWAGRAVDRFVAAKLREAGLRPVGPADRRALLRRLTFDLIGLPPTPAEIDTFLKDESPDAYARVVERLLASPHYGERWGRHWLDVVRYADTAGDNADYPVPEARLYRDYIIDSFNADKPFDRFVREQLAGDLLARQGPRERYAEQVVATTFLGLSRRYLTAPYEHWHLTVEDVIDTTGRAFLGMTLRCARCHDHKFDPVTQEDYYALYGIFAGTQFPYAGSEEFASKKFPRADFVPLVPPAEAAPFLEARKKRLAQLQADVARVEKDDPLARRVAAYEAILKAQRDLLRELTARQDPATDVRADLARTTRQRDEANGRLQKKLQPLRDELGLLEKTNLPADLPGAYGVRDGKPTDVSLQKGGDPDRPGQIVKRGVPKFLAGGQTFAITAGGSGRLELAEWLTRLDNPLTARVLVNRVWQHHFGKGLVATPSNFGLRGEPPTHPELLDWLTARFVEGGWSVKALHRLLVQSKTYQLASTHDETAAARDPGNRLYWHFDRRRLDAESIRDALLATSGRLDRRRPGPHPFPPMAAWRWTQHNPFRAVYPSDHRSVYLMTQRLVRHPFLALFDGPDTNTSTDTRTSSTVPLQALFLMNNPFVREQAQGLARRCVTAAPDLPGRVTLAYELTWGRPPTTADVAAAGSYLERYQEELSRTGVAVREQEVEAWTSLARVLYEADEFVYVD